MVLRSWDVEILIVSTNFQKRTKASTIILSTQNKKNLKIDHLWAVAETLYEQKYQDTFPKRVQKKSYSIEVVKIMSQFFQSSKMAGPQPRVLGLHVLR